MENKPVKKDAVKEEKNKVKEVKEVKESIKEPVKEEAVCEAVKFDDVKPQFEPIKLKRPEPLPEPFPEPETKSSISFNPSIESFDLPEEDGFSIGEDVPINVMNFSDLEPTIDLGIVEL